MASADLLNAEKPFATLECDDDQRTYSRKAHHGDCVLRVENVGLGPAVLAALGETITMDPAAPSQVDGERFLPAGSSVILTRNLGGFVHLGTSGATVLAVEDATE